MKNVFVLFSESRGAEYASKKKADCIREMNRLKKDDKENGGYEDSYYIEECEGYKEGRQ